MRYLLKFGHNEAPYSLAADGMSIDKFKNIYFAKGVENKDAVKVVSMKAIWSRTAFNLHHSKRVDDKIINKS